MAPRNHLSPIDERTTVVGIQIIPLTGEALGAEVLGLDLMNQPIDKDLISLIRRALLKYQVLVFRNQDNVSPAKHIEFSRHFGDLYPHALDEFRLPGYDDIVIVSNEVDEKGKSKGLNGYNEEDSKNGRRHYWHSDLSYMPDPPLGSILHTKVLPREGGDTLFADMYGAFESLDVELKEKLLGLQARHSFLNRASEEGLTRMVSDLNLQKIYDSLPSVVHPVIRTHPETGRKSLFVSELFTEHIIGLDPKESDNLLESLNAHAVHPKFVYRHRWQEGDMVFWDNRCTMHLATGSHFPRTLYRTTIKGDIVF